MVKQRENGELTFDENGYKRRAACVVFRDESEDEVSKDVPVHAVIISWNKPTDSNKFQLKVADSSNHFSAYSLSCVIQRLVKWW